MTTLLLICLIILTGISICKNYKKLSITMLIITVTYCLTVGCGLFASWLLNPLELAYITNSSPTWGKQNAIVVLGAGGVKLPGSTITKPTLIAYARITEGVRSYFACKKTGNVCKLIVSGGDVSKAGKSEAAIYQDLALDLGVAKTDILLEPDSQNTFKNAELTSHILKSKNFDQVFLVTSALHMKRALLYFSYFDIHPVAIISDYIPPKLSTLPLGYHFAMTDFAIHEEMGILRFYIYNFFGWNVKSSKAGAV